ncbi:transmembrane protein 268-like isoform X2 [Protopterus annectens]|uniref:transmembrane protein 268-like isoform X2 n=1 Tax=Protopterus annectens TaxID=7888 RepID=UPI001CF9F2D4|nr:transmembrane protein 268-like isoform X2 [Protopterus annectens]
MNNSPTAQQEQHEWNNFSAPQSFLDPFPEGETTTPEPVPDGSTNLEYLDSISDQSSTVLCDAVTPSSTLYNGRVIVMLSSSTTWCSSGFDLSACRKRFDEYGLQVPTEEYEIPIQKSLQTANVRRYMFFSSSVFFMILSPINVNTDVRLIWANENLIKHSLLVGVVDFMQNCRSELNLSFIYFDARECLKRLASLLEENHDQDNTFQSKVCKKMKNLSIMLEQSPKHTVITEESEDDGMSETSLLWEERRTSQGTNNVHGERTPAFNVVLNLVPEGTPQDMAYQLLAIHAGLYVKLLLTCRLPFSSSSRHAKEACVPCLCQYIENAHYSAS